jgi:hypothetical protein
VRVHIPAPQQQQPIQRKQRQQRPGCCRLLCVCMRVCVCVGGWAGEP